MNWTEVNLRKIMRSVFGYEDFKNDVQKQAIIAVNEGSKCVCISMPPGFGRSLCYQLPVMLQKHKIAVVFSPKLSAMKNHIDFLKSKQIKACLLSKTMKHRERELIVRDLTSDSPTIVLLYATADMAMMTYFQRLIFSLKTRKMLSYIVFNEAHCLTEKGYEYTPCYKRVLLDKIYGHVSKIAVTTTVTDEVIQDICHLLAPGTPRIFKIPVQQFNMQYDVWFLDILSNPFEHLRSFISEMLGFLGSAKVYNAFGIIYCREVATAELIKNKLVALSVSTLAYHHKLNKTAQKTIENEWIQGRANVIITTYDYSFIRKKPIRCIVYWTVPENIPKYYRECAQVCMNDCAHCRIYFSAKEYSSVKLLIENHRKFNNVEHIRKRLSEYNKFVSYCLYAKCRHGMISNYFGYVAPPCKLNCDVCVDKEKVNIRMDKFLSNAENVEKIEYNLCDINENLKKEQSKEKEEQLPKTVKSPPRKKVPKDRDSGEETVQYSDMLIKSKHKPSFEESCPLAAQLSTKDCIVRNSKEVKRAKDNSNAIGVSKRLNDVITTQYLIDKHKLNEDVISLELCSAGNNSSKRSRGTNKTQVSSKEDESKDGSGIRVSNSDSEIKTVRGRDHISSDSYEVTAVTGAKEHGKEPDKRTVVRDMCFEEYKSKRRKLGTENKPSDETRINTDSGTGDRNRCVERIEDDANERMSCGRTMVEYLMNKYKLDRDSITLEFHRK